MICPNCFKEVEWKDFYGKDICYKCTYAIKMQKYPPHCAICREIIKDTTRRKYCSKHCADVAAFNHSKKLMDEMKRMNVSPMDWNRYGLNFKIFQENEESLQDCLSEEYNFVDY